ncbi:MAG: glycerol-3-phosphate dehydrogenase [Silicimonas sp.]|nr:glycerol-3-phosphate dehydrogenase [Silicimonas sp.]
MSNSVVDLLVIGGGINGTGIARDAVGRGLSVVLAEKDDLAQGTSSRATKYIHGGLRYLEYYEFRLVREALKEREVILRAASHLASPLRLVLVHSPEQRPRWLVRLGLFLYDHLGGRKRIPATYSIRLDRDPEGDVVKDQYRHAFAYHDVWCDDARLVVLNAVDAARRGAEILTHTKVTSARREDGLWIATLEQDDGTTKTLKARALMNAGGPWVETVLGNVAGVNSDKRVRLVKGSHIITKRWWKGDHGYALQAPDDRLIFVNPYLDDLAAIGTTDIPFDGRAEDVAISPEETNYLLNILNGYFKVNLTSDDVIWDYSGVRPLFDDGAEGASAVTRDYTFEVDVSEGRAPIVSAFGGKLTTYRKLSEAALALIAPHLPQMSKPWTHDAPLPGGDFPDGDKDGWASDFRARHTWLPDPLARHLITCYGTDADRLLGDAKSLADLGAHFGGQFYEREARWLIDHEWARSADDLLFRRTKHGVTFSTDERESLNDWLATVG